MNFSRLYIGILAVLLISSCATKKKKGETSWLGKLYHNTTAKYNGYFNADVLIQESMVALEDQHQDNYNQLLSLYPYVDVGNPRSEAENLDKVIEKVTKVATLHEPSHWVDDCYIMMGRAQYLKHDYESARETFEYFEEDFDPNNPDSRIYDRAKIKTNNKEEKEKKRNEERKAKEEEQKEAKKKRDEQRKKREREKKEAEKKKKEEKERRKKEREAKEKERKKNKKRKKRGGKKRRPKKETPAKDSSEVKEEEKQESSEPTPTHQEQTSSASAEVDDTKEIVQTQQEIIEEEIAEDEEYFQELKERRAQYEKEKINNLSDGGGFLKHKPAYSEGLYWLARTYAEMSKFDRADRMIEKLRTIPNLRSEIVKELPILEAHLLIKQKKYAQAIPVLELGLEEGIAKSSRARAAYVLAQLYDLTGNSNNAMASFEKVKGYGADFEMEVNAKLSIERYAAKLNKKTNDQVVKSFDKMAKQQKYEPFLDQIYFNKGEVLFFAGREDEAFEAFQIASAKSKENPVQKAEITYRLAKLYLEKEDYVNAKNYFDTTKSHMALRDYRMPEVENYAKSLRGIASNYIVIKTQDSLMRIAGLSNEEQRAWAEKILEERKAEEEILEANSNIFAGPALQANQPLAVQRKPLSFNRSGTRESTFFAYDENLSKRGLNDFGKKWGTRVLADNWRRSSEQTTVLEDLGIIADDSNEESEDDQYENDIEDLLSQLPTGKMAQEKSHSQVASALFQLGKLFRKDFQNYVKSAQNLERLQKDYPKNRNELDALYYLYLDYIDLQKMSLANTVKTSILADYADSEYAQILSDPDYFKKLEQAEQDLDNYYQDTYASFENGQYENVLQMIEKANQQYGKDNVLTPQFDLLGAMCLGATQGKDVYLKSLSDVIAKHPNTDVEKRAKEIARFLRGDGAAFDSRIYEEESNQFSVDADRLHYGMVIVYKANGRQMQQAKIDVSNFAKKFYKSEKLKSSNIYLNKENDSQIILIRKFPNKDRAVEFVATVNKNPDEFIKADGFSYEVFAVNQKNYREIIKQRSINAYRAFYESHYQKNTE